MTPDTTQLSEPTVPLVRAEVRDFVARVREHLADLDADEQQELTAGLEADLADLVEERGRDALGDPAAYARELRTAAGHQPTMAGRPGRRGIRHAVMDAVDTLHETWDRLLDSFPGDLRGLLTTLQPVWWVVRGWVAWMVAQDVRGPWVVLDAKWLFVLAVFVLVSVQLGRRRWGADRLLSTSVLARLLLVALNVFAVTMTPGAADRLAWHVAQSRSYQFTSDPYGLQYDGSDVCLLQVRNKQGEVVKGAYAWDASNDRRLPTGIDVC